MGKSVTIIPGDGIGPEITKQVVRIVEASGADVSFVEANAGLVALKNDGELLPESTLNSIEETKVALKGPITTPVGQGFRSLNVQLRQTFDLYANVRPIKNLPGVPSHFDNVDMLIVRENTEGLYAGIENEVDKDTMESIKRLTRKGCDRIAKIACKLTEKRPRKKLQCVHKANILKKTDGMFLESCRQTAAQFSGIEFSDVIVDACCMQLVRWPEEFDVIVTGNLYGDILSDLGAGLVGGLGIVPGANIGNKIAIFEAVHGSAPDISGQNIANPTALLQSAIMMLEHMRMQDEAQKIYQALVTALGSAKDRTPDLDGQGTTASFADTIISNL